MENARINYDKIWERRLFGTLNSRDDELSNVKMQLSKDALNKLKITIESGTVKRQNQELLIEWIEIKAASRLLFEKGQISRTVSNRLICYANNHKNPLRFTGSFMAAAPTINGDELEDWKITIGPLSFDLEGCKISSNGCSTIKYENVKAFIFPGNYSVSLITAD